MAPFLRRAKQEHLAFDYTANAYPHDVIYPALSPELARFFDQNGLSVPRTTYINELIDLSELQSNQSSPPRLFEILICKQRGSQGRPGTLKIGMEDGLSTESLTYEKMVAISKRYHPDRPEIVIFIGTSFIYLLGCVIVNAHFTVPRMSVFVQAVDGIAHYCRSAFLYKGFTTAMLNEPRNGPTECWPQCHPVCPILSL